MKTRNQIYGKEAAGLLKIINMYPGLSEEQLCRFYPDRKDKIPAVLTALQRQGRIFIRTQGDNRPKEYLPGDYLHGEQLNKAHLSGRDSGNVPDSGLIRAVWVLLDFIEKVEYHAAGEFPVKVIFFADGELYEIIHAAKEQEALLGHILNQIREEDGKKIILVDETDQIARIEIDQQRNAAVSGFCTVDTDGSVQYYQKA